MQAHLIARPLRLIHLKIFDLYLVSNDISFLFQMKFPNYISCISCVEQLDGQDPNDPTTLDFSKFDAQFGKALDTSKPLKVGIPEEFNIKELEDNVLDAWKKSIDSFCHAGHSVRQVSIPSIPYALPVYYILAAAEASSNLSRYTGLFYGFADTQDFSSLQEFFSRNRSSGFGDEVKKRILLGTFVLSSTHYQSFFVKAQKIRSKISEEFQKVFREVDVLLLPTGSSTAPPLTYFSENPDPL